MSKKLTVFLDTETTGLHPPADKIVELAIIDHSDMVLINTLINPRKPIPERVIGIHGIHEEMVKDAPLLEDVMEDIRAIFQSVGKLIIYNAEFDVRFFPEDIWGHADVICCMKEFIYIYEELEGFFSSKRFPLSKAFNVATGRKIEELGGQHRALSDCRACRMVWDWCVSKRGIIDDPGWKKSGYRVYCSHCRQDTFHKFRPRYRDGFDKYYQCMNCLQNNISVSEIEALQLKHQ